MKLFIEMTLQSDAVFGNGLSMPGGEDIATQMDDQGFPYLKGNTMKGLFREELINLLAWTGKVHWGEPQMINQAQVWS